MSKINEIFLVKLRKNVRIELRCRVAPLRSRKGGETATSRVGAVASRVGGEKLEKSHVLNFLCQSYLPNSLPSDIMLENSVRN
jgi:hypothetical protein